MASSDTKLSGSKFPYLDKELTGQKLTSGLLNQILEKEIKRKEILTNRAKELRSVTMRGICERGEKIEKSMSCSKEKLLKLRTQVDELMLQKLPNKINNSQIVLILEEIEELEKSKDYLTTQHFIAFLSQKIKTCIAEGDDDEGVEYFKKLRRLNLALVDSKCKNLYNYSSKVLSSWHEDLLVKFSKNFESLLEKVGWPSRLNTANPTLEIIKKFQSSAECLMRLGPSSPSANNEQTKLSETKEFILPIQIMMKPLIKRFHYHFYTNRPTNDDSRPDWYFIQVKEWIRELLPFVEQHLEEVGIEELETSPCSHFIQSFALVLVQKTHSLLSAPSLSDSLFSKLLEESMSFESELCGGTSGEEGEAFYFVNTLFSAPQILSRWLSVERAACFEKLDALFDSSSAWERAVEHGPTEIGDLFILMLQFLSDRFAHLRQPGHKLQFIELMLDVSDDFKIRSFQIWQSQSQLLSIYSPPPLSSVLIDFSIADTLSYVSDTLAEWETLPFFSSLRELWLRTKEAECEERGSESLGSQELFGSTYRSYKMLSESIRREWVKYGVRIYSGSLLDSSYFSSSYFSPLTPLGAEEMSEEFRKSLALLASLTQPLCDGVHERLALDWLQALANKIDNMITNRYILECKDLLSPLHRTRVCIELKTGLFPLLTRGNEEVENIFFPSLSNIVELWSMSKGNTLLLNEALGIGSEVEKKEALFESQLQNLPLLDVKALLSLIIKQYD